VELSIAAQGPGPACDSSGRPTSPLVIDLTGARHRDPHRPFGIVRFERLTAQRHVLISQSRMEFDPQKEP